MRGNCKGLVSVCVWFALALTVGTAGAGAAPSWLPPQDISGPTELITVPDLAGERGGRRAGGLAAGHR